MKEQSYADMDLSDFLGLPGRFLTKFELEPETVTGPLGLPP